jgi:hypothetical protein
MGFGAIVDAEDFRPWLHDARINGEVGDFYWGRYRKLLNLKGLPKSVIDATDEVTDRVLDRLGDPTQPSPWSRRGMVVGHVQSGKTANYTGLICKAADAGYRLIVVIAGIHNNLRNQTQARIDEGFIGRDTGRLAHANKAQRQKIIGVGTVRPARVPGLPDQHPARLQQGDGHDQHQPDRAVQRARGPGDQEELQHAEEPAGMAEGTFRPPGHPDGQPAHAADRRRGRQRLDQHGLCA